MPRLFVLTPQVTVDESCRVRDAIPDWVLVATSYVLGQQSSGMGARLGPNLSICHIP